MSWSRRRVISYFVFGMTVLFGKFLLAGSLSCIEATSGWLLVVCSRC
ncbi:hypothetical protein SAMN05216215_103540 [Saccharopolyspora shandongensis]|uniref:Uncharacterized protein n=1 Tax=Saccharopolyspora shandongensis TaxID=418495 RepID=A0A1H3MUB7_9PSEU|nr:hypothetical protein SAMN05216215_103540 [Saccharopolyspora shandongensis]